jgi:hypothetical protein
MYTKTFPKVFRQLLRFTSGSGVSSLYFNPDKQLFFVTKEAKLKCQKLFFLNTFLFTFISIRTIQAKLRNDSQFPYCYMALLAETFNSICLAMSIFRPEESAFSYTQLYRFAQNLMNTQKGKVAEYRGICLFELLLFQ